MSQSMFDLSQASQTWMEHQSLEHIKRALRVTIEWHAPAIRYFRKRQSVTFAFESFARHLERLMSLEEDDGYMTMVADAKPNKAKQIATLRADHARMRRQVDQLSADLAKLDEWQEPEFERICTDIGRLLDSTDQHDRAEIDLLQDALLMDEGGGD
ncbi:hypothetical protein [Aeoliella sp. SH292]|uniref:hypothetical protein n=1 Tax=Aeoliella sp. SH292 TaxID=3454464 RepID=UPI003F9CF9DB